MPGEENEGSIVWEVHLTLLMCASAALLFHICCQTENHSSSNIPFIGLVQSLAVTAWGAAKPAPQFWLYYFIPKRPLMPSGA